MKPACGPASFCRRREPKGAGASAGRASENRTARPKKKPTRWGRAGFVLLGRRCCYEVRRMEHIGART